MSMLWRAAVWGRDQPCTKPWREHQARTIARGHRRDKVDPPVSKIKEMVAIIAYVQRRS
jgi:hypothetical protein